jgi:transposase-like protein
MPAPRTKKKVLKYSDREKLTAVRLSEAPGVKVKDVAAALDACRALPLTSIVRQHCSD